MKSKFFILFVLIASFVFISCKDSPSSHSDTIENSDVNQDINDVDNSDYDEDTQDNVDTGDATDIVETHPPLAIIQIYNYDIWAHPLVRYEADATMLCDGNIIPSEDGTSIVGNNVRWPLLSFKIQDSTNCTYTLSNPNFFTLSFSFEINDDGSVILNRNGTDGHGLSSTHSSFDYEDKSIPVHSFYVGLRHKWFSPEARPPRRGNDIELHMDGEDAWSNMYNDLQSST